MAAPTNVRVEAISITSTVLRWTHASEVAVYRSTDGMSFAEVAVATDSYTDTELDTGTKYWYKLTDDSGSTFSDEVTVWTHACGGPVRQNRDNALPRAYGDTVEPEDFNDLAVKVETGWTRFISPDGRTCIACISDGALIIDCIEYDSCAEIEVEVTEDINSISLPNCENSEFNINFIIPPNTTRRICGWPGGIGFTGDECTQAPVRGGSSGRNISEFVNRALNVNPRSGRSKPGTTTRGQPQSSGCTCVPSGNSPLTIRGCNANNSLQCTTTRSLRVVACGGRPPYTWSKTGSIVLSSTSGESTTVTPPANAGSAVVGKAYTKSIFGIGCGHTIGTNHAAGQTKASHNCDDSLNLCPDGVVGGAAATVLAFLDSSCSCSVHSGHAISGAGAIVTVSCTNTFATGAECAACQAVGSVADVRTAGMISDGCAPCGLQTGSTVSVTDALGIVATIVVRA